MPEARAAARSRAWPAIVLATVFLALTLPVIAAQRGGTAGALDQELYHLPTIAAFADELPTPDLDAVNAPMGPLFHLSLAPVARFVSRDRPPLQLVALLLSLAAVLSVYLAVARFVDGPTALALSLPLACSHYVVQSAGWLNTDNTALLFVVVALAASLAFAEGRAAPWLAGFAALLAVLTRQIHVWTGGVVVLAGVLASAPGERGPLRQASLAAAMPLLGLTLLVAVWGGLTPPRIEGQLALTAEVFAFTLSLFGLFAIPYLLVAGQSLKAIAASAARDRVAAGVAVAGALTALAPPPLDAIREGLTGGALWLAVEKTPVVAGLSPLLALLAAWGALVALHWWRVHHGGPRANQVVLVLAALGGLAVAHATTVNVLHKYFEPLVIALLALLAAMTLSEAPPAARIARRRMFAVLGGLVAIQFAGVCWEVYREVARSAPVDRAYERLKERGD